MFEQFPEEDGIIMFRPVGGTIEYGEDSKSAVKGLIGLRGECTKQAARVQGVPGVTN